MSEKHTLFVSKRIPTFITTLMLALALLVSMVIPHAFAATPTITEYGTGISASSEPREITEGPDGNLWFTEGTANKIGKITTAGVVTEYVIPTASSSPRGITAGPDGNLWFTEETGNKIGKITPDGAITEYAVTTASSSPTRITAGPDGNLWFTEGDGNNIGKITTSGVVTEYPITTASSQPRGITAGPDGNLWFTESIGNKVAKITTSGVVTEYAVTTSSSAPNAITVGSDGNLWFTEVSGNNVGKVTTAGVVTEYAIPTATSQPRGITAGPDGNLWFSELIGNKIGKITTAGVFTEYAVTTAGAQPDGIALGPDGNLWFTEGVGNKIGQVVLIPSVTSGGSTITTINAGDNFSSFDYTVVSGQTLIVNGQVGDVTVESGGTLKGTGTVGDITVNSGGHVAPGTSPGCLNAGNTTFVSGSSLDIELAGATVCTEYDQLRVTGSIDLGNTTLNTALLNSYVPAVGAAFTIVSNDGADAVVGTFNGLAEGATFTASGVTYKVSYVGGDGNDVVLTVQSVSATAAPGTPDTGFGLVAAHPAVSAGVTTMIALGMLFAARRLKPAAIKK